MPTYGGWTGKTLRVNLTTRTSTVENTLDKYGEFWGGAAMGYKVLWDETTAETKPLDEGNKIIFGWGPLTGTGAPCGGRTAITALSPQHPFGAVATGHMGGHFSAEAKYAGWDGIIIEGKASNPVYISIMDDKVEVVDADQLWGNGLYRVTAEITEAMGGGSTQVAAIGQAGQNLVAQSVIMTNYSHSAGGQGAVMGSKKLLGIGVKGTGTVPINASKKAWKTLIDYSMSLVGSNNQAVVPNSPQPWAEYTGASSVRWYAKKGQFWGGANPPVETGTCEPHDRQSVGLRCFKSDPGEVAREFTVRMDGCHACPVRCHQDLMVPTAAKWGVDPTASNTCTGWWGRGIMDAAKVKGTLTGRDADLKALESYVVGKHMTDDFGLHNNYGTTDRGWKFIYGDDKGVTYIQPNVPAAEWTSLNATNGLFDLYEKGDLNFIKKFGQIMAGPIGELGKFLGGAVEEGLARWETGTPGITAAYHADTDVVWWANGFPKHHSTENGAQVGGLINVGYNRDAQNHCWSNYLSCGLPTPLQREIATDLFGAAGYTNGYAFLPGHAAGDPIAMGDAIDPNSKATPMNRAKAVAAIWATARKELTDALGICSWMWPWIPSPLKERNYRGDIGLEAKLFSAATGMNVTTLEFDRMGVKFYLLQRALTQRAFKSANMRVLHDQAPPWVFASHHPGSVAFDGSNYYLTEEDWDNALDLYYDELGFNKTSGSLSRSTLVAYGMTDVADELEAAGLLSLPPA